MDGEFPPPYSGDFEHDVDALRQQGDEDDNECFGHIPIPEMENNFPAEPGLPIKASPVNLNGVLPKLAGRIEDTAPNESDVEVNENGSLSPEGADICEQTTISITNMELTSEIPEVNGYPLQNKSEASLVEPEGNIDPPQAFLEENDDKVNYTDAAPSANLSIEVAVKPHSVEDCDADINDDEFGDFAETTGQTDLPEPVQAATVSNTVAQSEDEDDWGDFDKAPRRDSHLTSAASLDEEEDGFGAFGSATINEHRSSLETPESWTPQFAESPRDASVENWEETLLNSVMEIDWQVEDVDEATFDEDCVTEISSVMSAPNHSISDICPLRRSFELWCLLRIVEEAKSLQYVFEGSSLATNHYKKINIDKNNTVKGTLSPLSSNTLLTPIPVNGSVAKPTASSETTTPPLETKDKESSPPTTSTTSAFDSLSAPPAEFDWDASGLTNTLKSTKGSALLDVGFLSANSGGSSSGAFTLQKDLEAFGLDTTAASGNKSTEKSILDTILSSNTPQAPYRPIAELSLDARALHDQLPDLSCLLSKKVMLPFSGEQF